MRVDVLGPLQVEDHVAHGAFMAKERAVLEVLALQTNATVPRADLERALWGESPPPTAHKTLATHVSRLRRELGHDLIAGDPGGYRLTLPRDSVDVFCLEALVRAGAQALDRRAPAEARRHFSAAEALWRGEPLTDLADSVEKDAQVARLHLLAQEAQQGRLRAEVDLGRHEEILPELERLTAQDPLREPLCWLLMLALYRAGRQVDALRAYRRLQSGLAEEWGVDPGPDLQRLEWQILRQDPQLDLDPPPPPLVVPATWSSIVGRDAELAELASALPTCRLITLRGPAGVGKSRLALEVARAAHPQFADGVWWVDLTVVGTGNAALGEVARTLGVVAPPGGSLEEALVAHLAQRQLLLVLDNCEHVVDAVAPLAVMLVQAAPALSILATSRVELAVAGELSWEVCPLATPADSEHGTLAGSAAVQLFLERRGGRAAGQDEDELREIGALCRTLDGLPLALELAAARARHVSVSSINARLDAKQEGPSGPDSSSPDAPPTAPDLLDTAFRAARTPHHASLGRAVDWSYRMLRPGDQRAFAWLSVFPGNFDQRTAERLLVAMNPQAGGQAGCLTRLAEASLVEAHPNGTTAYRLLFVMREQAAAHLAERGETTAARQAFTDTMRALAVEAGPHLDGAQPGYWLGRLRAELPSLRAAVRWSIGNEPRVRTLAFARSIGRILWSDSPDLQKDVALLRRLVEDCDDASDAALGWGWQQLVTASYLAGDLALAMDACDRAEALFTRAGDGVGLAVAHWHRGAAQMLGAGDLAGAEKTLRRGSELARAAGAPTPEAWNLAHLVQLLYLRGEAAAETDSLMARAEALADPRDDQLQSHLAMNRTFVALARGDSHAALELARESADQARRCRISAYEQASLLGGAYALLGGGQTDAARTTSLRAAQVALDTGNTMQLGLALQLLAVLSRDPQVAAQLWGAAEVRAPVFPAFALQLDLGPVRSALGDRFDPLVASGHDLRGREALDLAVG